MDKSTSLRYMENTNQDLSKLLLKKLQDVSLQCSIRKDNKNEFGGFNYRTLEQILEHVKPILQKNGCMIRFIDDIREIGDRYYYMSECRFYSIDIGTDLYLNAFGYARETNSRPKMDEAQVTGAASSYARKYAISSLLLIDENKDLDSMDNTELEGHKMMLTAIKSVIEEYNKTKDKDKALSSLRNLYKTYKQDVISNIANALKEDKMELIKQIL